LNFDCGKAALNDYLIHFVLTNQLANTVQTYLGVAGDEVVGFYTLVFGEVAFEHAPERFSKGLARYPVLITRSQKYACERQRTRIPDRWRDHASSSVHL
jgi:hypothetical protein